MPDLVESDVNGLLHDPLDPDSMCGAVERLLADRPAATRLAARARAQAMERYHPGIVARRHVEIYREVLNERPATVLSKP